MTSKHYSLDAVLVALAVTARVAAVVVLQSHHVARSTYEHGEIAANLLAGRGFSIRFLGAEGPTSQQAPIYPLLVASAYAVGGVEQPAALLLIELGQSVLGGLLVLGVLQAIAPDRAWVSRSGLVGRAHHGTSPQPGLRGHARPGGGRGSDAPGMGFVLGLPRGDDGLPVGRDHRGCSSGAVGFDRSDPVTRGHWRRGCHRPGPFWRASRLSSNMLAEPDHVALRPGSAWHPG